MYSIITLTETERDYLLEVAFEAGRELSLVESAWARRACAYGFSAADFARDVLRAGR